MTPYDTARATLPEGARPGSITITASRGVGTALPVTVSRARVRAIDSGGRRAEPEPLSGSNRRHHLEGGGYRLRLACAREEEVGVCDQQCCRRSSP